MSANKLKSVELKPGCDVCSGRSYATTDPGMIELGKRIAGMDYKEVENFVKTSPCASFFYALSRKDELVAKLFVSTYNGSPQELLICGLRNNPSTRLGRLAEILQEIILGQTEKAVDTSRIHTLNEFFTPADFSADEMTRQGYMIGEHGECYSPESTGMHIITRK